MADFKPMVKKNVEHKRYPRVVVILKEIIRVSMIIKHILNIRVNFTMGKLLALVPVIEK